MKSGSETRHYPLKIADGQQKQENQIAVRLIACGGCHLYCTRRGDRLGTRPQL